VTSHILGGTPVSLVAANRMPSTKSATDANKLMKLSRRETRSSAIAMSAEGQAAKGLGEDDEGNANAQMILDMDVSLVGAGLGWRARRLIALGLLLRCDDDHKNGSFVRRCACAGRGSHRDMADVMAITKCRNWTPPVNRFTGAATALRQCGRTATDGPR
jgi:hypothetical protein